MSRRQNNLSGSAEGRVQKADAGQDEKAADCQVGETETISDAGLHSRDDGGRTNRSENQASPAQNLITDTRRMDWLDGCYLESECFDAPCPNCRSPYSTFKLVPRFVSDSANESSVGRARPALGLAALKR